MNAVRDRTEALPRRRPAPLDELLRETGARLVILAMSKDPNAKITALITPPGRSGPALAAKIPTTPRAARAVITEESRLRVLGEIELGNLAGTIPVVLERREHLAMPVLVMTALRGRPMTRDYHRWRHTAMQRSVAADFSLATAWISAFQDATRGGIGSAAFEADICEVLESRFGPKHEALTITRRATALLSGLRLTRTAVHGDYWCGNILVADGRVSGVIDWEHASIRGNPLRDNTRFALSYCLYLDRHTRPQGRVAGHPGLRADSWGAGVVHAATGQGWLPEIFRRSIQGALLRCGLPATAWRALVLSGLAEIAATADSPEFAEQHVNLIVALTRRGFDVSP